MEPGTDKSWIQQGMGLAEVLASLVILLLLTVSFMTIFTTAQVWIMKAGKRVQASEYASSIIENVRANSDRLSTVELTGNPLEKTYTDPNNSDSVFSISDLNLTVDDPNKFSEQVTVSQFTPGNSNLYKIEAAVSWLPGSNNRVILSTVVRTR